MSRCLGLPALLARGDEDLVDQPGPAGSVEPGVLRLAGEVLHGAIHVNRHRPANDKARLGLPVGSDLSTPTFGILSANAAFDLFELVIVPDGPLRRGTPCPGATEMNPVRPLFRARLAVALYGSRSVGQWIQRPQQRHAEGDGKSHAHPSHDEAHAPSPP